MENKNDVPYIVYEGEQARNERTIRRLTIVIVLCLILSFLSNAIWLYEWTQYDYVSESTETVTVDGKDGTANYIGNDGNITNGEGCSKAEDSSKTGA